MENTADVRISCWLLNNRLWSSLLEICQSSISRWVHHDMHTSGRESARHLQCIEGSLARCQKQVLDNWQRRKSKKRRSETSVMFTKSTEALPTSKKLKNSANWLGDINFEVNLADMSPIIKEQCFCWSMRRSISDYLQKLSPILPKTRYPIAVASEWLYDFSLRSWVM